VILLKYLGICSDFAQILRDFQQIKIFGGALAPPTPLVMTGVRRVFYRRVGAGKDLAQGAHKSINGLLSGPAKHALQAILSSSLQNFKGTTSVIIIPWFFLAAPLLPE